MVYNEYTGGDTTYNISIAVELSGDVHISSLELTIEAIIRRHEILRTTFGLINDVPKQIIAEYDQKRYPLIVTEGIGEGRMGVEAFIDKCANHIFNLNAGPLIAFNLFKIGSDKHIFVVTMHHIISDGWSMGILLKEFTHYYEVFSRSKGAELNELQLQFADYSEWHHKYIENSKQELLKYWKQQLKGFPKLLSLPLDFERTAKEDHRSEEVNFAINRQLGIQIRDLCTAERITPYMFFLTMYAIFLSKYCGETDIVIGSPVANRNRKEIETLIGFFVNNLALRIKIDESETGLSLLSQVRVVTLEALKHQDLPFDLLVEELGIERIANVSPIFQVFFAFQNAPVPPMRLSGLEVRQLKIKSQLAKYDFCMFVEELDDIFNVKFEYRVALFKRDTVERFSKNFLTLITSFLAEPQGLISSMNIISAEEQRTLLETFNETFLPYPQDKNVVTIFEAKVAEQEEEVAIIFGEKTWRYGELNKLSNQFANYLLDRAQIETGSIIGVMVERSPYLVMSLLGILKCACCYVPLEPIYPSVRVDFILKECGSKFLVTNEVIEDFLQNKNKYCDVNIQKSILPNDLAYVIYTSGSTGAPKGVMIAHRSLSSFLAWCFKEFKNSNYDVVYFTTSVCFDLSIFEIFFTLCAGSKLRLLSSAIEIPTYLLLDERILLNTVPSVVSTLITANLDLSNVFILNMAGEPVPRTFLRVLDFNRMEIRNLYGPTEDTTYSTVFSIKNDEQILIGKPISNSQIYILDANQKLLPLGAVGEIFITGHGLANGYLNRPDLTAEKFVGNQFKKGTKMYKTGDFGKWVEDGNISYLGRKDNQVKVRGYRIELSEIEQALSSHANVEKAIVAIKRNTQEDPIIAAYFTSVRQCEVSELRKYLRTTLPEFMVPDFIMQLNEFPLNPNGKIDVGKLSLDLFWAEDRVDIGKRPVNETEQIIVRIWSDILNIDADKIFVNDNFFQLGGSSLKIISVISRIASHFGVRPDIKTFFNDPTIESLSAYVSFYKSQSGKRPETGTFQEIII